MLNGNMKKLRRGATQNKKLIDRQVINGLEFVVSETQRFTVPDIAFF